MTYTYSWRASYVIVAMLDDFDKGFSLFAILISSNMAKISLFIESLGDGCTPRIPGLRDQIEILSFEHAKFYYIRSRACKMWYLQVLCYTLYKA